MCNRRLIRARFLLILMVVGFAGLLFLNQQSLFTHGEIAAFYSDAQYIAQVAANIVQGEGYSYWDGFVYSFLDYEISTGPVVIYPLALSLLLGVDKYDALFFVPIILNSALLLIVLMMIQKRCSSKAALIGLPFLCLFLVLNQRWLWYLPLGEVPGMLLLLISLLYLLFDRQVNKAGLVFGLVLLTKLMFCLIAPVVGLYVWLAYGFRRAVLFVVSMAVPIFIFMASLFFTAPADVSIMGMLELLLGLAVDSLAWSVPEIIYHDQFAAYSFVDKFLWNAKVFNGVWWDNLDLIYLIIYSSIFLVLTAYRYVSSSRVDRYQLLLLIGVVVVFFVWAFCVGLKGGRYGYPLLISVVAANLYLLRYLPKIPLLLALLIMILPLIHQLDKRGLVLDKLSNDSVSEAQEAALVLKEWLDLHQYKQVVFGKTLYKPYLNLSYHMDNSHQLLYLFAYLDGLPILDGEYRCDNANWPHIWRTLSAGEKRSRVARCIAAEQVITVAINDVKLALLEYKPEHEVCGELLWRAGGYELYQCLPEDFSQYLQRITDGLVSSKIVR